MISKTLYWIPRILTILAIIFMFMFSLDSFGGNGSIGKKMISFFMNNIPVLILAGILVIAWKQEVVGGILLIVAFIAASILFKSFNGNPQSLILIFPFLLTGILFILHHLLYGRNSAGKLENNA